MNEQSRSVQQVTNTVPLDGGLDVCPSGFANRIDRRSSLLLPTLLVRRLLEEEAALEAKRQAEADAQEKAELQESGHWSSGGDRVLAALDMEPRARDRSTCIFELENIKRSWETIWKRQDRDRRIRSEEWFISAGRGCGHRTVPKWSVAKLEYFYDVLSASHPHFGSAISYLRTELAVANASKPEKFRVSPLLLHGAPGIGKTAFAISLAKTLKVGFESISAGGTQGAFDICGTSTHWSNASPGKVFMLLAHGQSATPVLLLDEVDKFGQDEKYPSISSLLDLLEQDSASRFRDEALGMRFDVSKIIVIATANDIERIPAPLLSRLHAIEVHQPSAQQRREIVRAMFEKTLEDLSMPLGVADECVNALADVETDLRVTSRLVRATIGEGLRAGKELLTSADAPVFTAKQKRQIGFLHSIA